ncbi:hypothetical protein [Cryptosporangium japonicum]|uniref:hypothetical protein n=1 Tax=Cryptosporangium japonicum TaxID=80872 RepID=UPI0031E0B361
MSTGEAPAERVAVGCLVVASLGLALGGSAVRWPGVGPSVAGAGVAALGLVVGTLLAFGAVLRRGRALPAVRTGLAVVAFPHVTGLADPLIPAGGAGVFLGFEALHVVTLAALVVGAVAAAGTGALAGAGRAALPVTLVAAFAGVVAAVALPLSYVATLPDPDSGDPAGDRSFGVWFAVGTAMLAVAGALPVVGAVVPGRGFARARAVLGAVVALLTALTAGVIVRFGLVLVVNDHASADDRRGFALATAATVVFTVAELAGAALLIRGAAAPELTTSPSADP